MANKVKTVFVCSNCGYESTKWLGKCPGCGEWNSFYEEKIQGYLQALEMNQKSSPKSFPLHVLCTRGIQ